MKRVTYLLLIAVLVFAAGIGLWYSNQQTAGEILLWVGLLAFALGILLLVVFALTRFVVWAARR